MQQVRLETMRQDWPDFAGKLRPGQIANQSTWGRVPEVDAIKAASHVIRVTPAGSTTVTQMFDLDPGITDMTVGEGRGWYDPPRTFGADFTAGRGMR